MGLLFYLPPDMQQKKAIQQANKYFEDYIERINNYEKNNDKYQLVLQQ